jgi:acetoin utilization deacetylase AcuC-like enzyme
VTTALISHRECLRHNMGAWHPEAPARLQAVEDQLIASGLVGHFAHYDAPLVQRDELERVHEAAYIDAIQRAVPRTGLAHLDPDTAGAVVLATDLVALGSAENAFCNVRPPGHHAGPNRAMGFCFFNNVAVGAAHALERHGVERIAIADFDVHHGNGTEAIFSADPRVLMVSTFQHPFYPYSGTEGRSPRMVNIPLAAYSAGKEFRAAVEEHWLPALERHQPQMIFVSAGFDAHRDDDMAMLGLVEADYAWVTATLKAVADRHSGGRIVSALEGGYELHALGRSAAAHLKVLAGL